MKTITIRHSSTMELPKSVRSYIDNHADEFKELDAWTKIAQIAYRIKRGAGAELLMDVMRTLQKKASHRTLRCCGQVANVICL